MNSERASEATASGITDGVLKYLQSMVAFRNQIESDTLSLSQKIPSDWVYRGMEDFLLKHGRFWTPRELPSGIRRMAAKQCFDNTFKLVSRRKSLRYVEGIAVGIIPMHHAWAVDDDGNVIDPTWASTATGLGAAYFGVAFDINIVRTYRHSECLCVLNNWKHDFEIYKKPFAV